MQKLELVFYRWLPVSNHSPNCSGGYAMASVTRRDFLRAAGLGAAALTVPGLRAWAKAAPSERVRLGFIGIRNQGTNNLKGFLKQPAAQVVALCDVDKNVLAAAKALAKKTNGGTCDTYHDYRQLLDRKDIDAVVVTTPDHWHALPTIQACAAGKDVYCEKPLSLTVAEGQAMVKAARGSNRIVQTGSQQRSEYKGMFRIAAELVRDGRLGALKAIKCGIPGVNYKQHAKLGAPDGPPPAELDYDFWLGPAPKRPYNVNRVHYLFRFFWDYSGGQLTNFGAHQLDIAQWAMGMDESGPVEISATAQYNKDGWYEVPERQEVTYRYANGVSVLCGQAHKDGCTFECEKGTVHVDRKKLEADPAELLKDAPIKEYAAKYPTGSHHANWLECVKSRKLPAADAAIGHRTATVCHLGNIAIRTGRTIRWDPQAEQIVGDADAAAMLSRPYRKPWALA
jgi:predicted dehydrogenase